jgi:hypothetical protein
MSNVPQDVMENTHKPDLIEKLSGLAKSIEVCEGWRPTCIDEAIAQLRAQRQQGSEPVAWAVESIGNPDTNYGRVKSFETLAEAKQRAKELYDAGFEDIKALELYTATPDMAAGIAAGMVKAAELAEECADQQDMVAGALAAAKHIRNSIPADSEAALREVCMKVARTVYEEATPDACKDDELEAIVNSIIGASDKVEGGK